MEKEAKILITGTTGMVGKNLLELLQHKGYNNILQPTKNELNLKERTKVLEYFKKEKPKYIFHLAAKVGGIQANINQPVEFLRDNTLINTNIIDACYETNIKKLVNLGSSCIYPKNCEQPMKEEHLLTGPLEPTNEGYALAKITSLKLCKYYNEQHKTNYISIMPPNLYGKHEKYDETTSHVLSALLQKFHKAKKENKKEVTVWGTGKAKREFLNVEDLAKILYFAMEELEVKDLHENCFINCGSEEEISIKELAETIKEITKYEGTIHYDTTKPEGMKRKIMNSKKLKEKGYKKFITLKEGITKMYEEYQKEKE